MCKSRPGSRKPDIHRSRIRHPHRCQETHRILWRLVLRLGQCLRAAERNRLAVLENCERDSTVGSTATYCRCKRNLAGRVLQWSMPGGLVRTHGGRPGVAVGWQEKEMPLRAGRGALVVPCVTPGRCRQRLLQCPVRKYWRRDLPARESKPGPRSRRSGATLEESPVFRSSHVPQERQALSAATLCGGRLG